MQHSSPRRGLILFFWLLASSLVAAEVRQQPFIDPKAIDARQILAGPSAPGSRETLGEIEIVLARQVERTPVDETRINREGKWSPLLFDDVLGPGFTERELPFTMGFLDEVGRETMTVCEEAKKRWSR